jgi:hypothetical protein
VCLLAVSLGLDRRSMVMFHLVWLRFDRPEGTVASRGILGKYPGNVVQTIRRTL